MEIALYNVSVREARILKQILKEEWLKLSPRLASIKVQGIDKIKMIGHAVKTFGIVAQLQPKFIQFEFSRKLRNKQEMLSMFLINSIKRIQNDVF